MEFEALVWDHNVFFDESVEGIWGRLLEHESKVEKLFFALLIPLRLMLEDFVRLRVDVTFHFQC